MAYGGGWNVEGAGTKGVVYIEKIFFISVNRRKKPNHSLICMPFATLMLFYFNSTLLRCLTLSLAILTFNLILWVLFGFLIPQSQFQHLHLLHLGIIAFDRSHQVK